MRLIGRLSLIGVAIIVIGVPLSALCGRKLLTMLYQPEYGNHVATFSLLVAATGVSAIAFFVTAGLNAARFYRPQVVVYAASTAAITVSCLLLAPHYKLNGAAFSLLIASIVWLAGSFWLLRSLAAKMAASAATAETYA